jgi:hypothetical protein
VRFRCPATGEVVDARATVPADTSVSSKVSRTVQQSLMWSLKGAVSSAIRSALGHGIAGRVAGDLAYGVMNEATRSTSAATLSRAEQEAGAVEAFVQVRGRFAWDPGRGAWVSAKAARELLSDFDQQLSAHPIVHPYDRQVMARMLVQVCRADGRLGAEEQGWLTDLITPDLGAVADLAQRPPLSDAELRNTSPGGLRESLLLMAWAIALVDEQLEGAESEALRAFARGLGLRDDQAARVKLVAQVWMLDQALEHMFAWGGHDAHARDQLFALARRLGLSQAEALEAEARFQRRRA